MLSDEVEKAKRALLGHAWEDSAVAYHAAMEAVAGGAAMQRAVAEYENRQRAEIEALSRPAQVLAEMAKSLAPQRAWLDDFEASLSGSLTAKGIVEQLQANADALAAAKAATAQAQGSLAWQAIEDQRTAWQAAMGDTFTRQASIATALAGANADQIEKIRASVAGYAIAGSSVRALADQAYAEAVGAARAFATPSLSDMARAGIADLRSQWRTAIGIGETAAHYESIAKAAAGRFGDDQIEKARASFAAAAGYVSAADQRRQLMEALSGTVAASLDVAQLAGNAGLVEAMNYSAASIARQYADQAEKLTSRWREMAGHTPTFDAATILALAQVQGADGLAKQFSALGLRPEDYLGGGIGSPEEDDADHTESRHPLAEFVTPRLDDLRQLIINLVASCLWVSLLSSFIQNPDMDAVNKRFDQVDNLITRLPELLAPLVEQAVRRELGEDPISFAVKERTAQLRTDPVEGTRVVAVAFPNQVLTLLEEQGKWIRVEFYDYVAQDVKEGWVLKKYCQRITRDHLARGSHSHRSNRGN